jgi:hypothetical protein
MSIFPTNTISGGITIVTLVNVLLFCTWHKFLWVIVDDNKHGYIFCLFVLSRSRLGAGPDGKLSSAKKTALGSGVCYAVSLI